MSRPRFWWNRNRSDNKSLGTIAQRIFNRFANAVVTTQVIGQPRYFDDDGVALASIAVTGSGATGALTASIQEDISEALPFTHYTAELASAAVDDVIVFPAVPAANDVHYYGAPFQFSTVNFIVGQAGIGTYTVTWEYWNGTAWAALAAVVDGTTDYKTAGAQTVTYTLPPLWEPTTVDTTGPLYFIRSVFNAGTYTTVALLTSATADIVAVPDLLRVPNFYGAHYSGKIALWWEATTLADTIDVNVWVRTDSVVAYDGRETPENIVFQGEYALANNTTGIVDRGELIIDTGFRPVYVEATSANAGTLRLGYV